MFLGPHRAPHSWDSVQKLPAGSGGFQPVESHTVGTQFRQSKAKQKAKAHPQSANHHSTNHHHGLCVALQARPCNAAALQGLWMRWPCGLHHSCVFAAISHLSLGFPLGFPGLGWFPPGFPGLAGVALSVLWADQLVVHVAWVGWLVFAWFMGRLACFCMCHGLAGLFLHVVGRLAGSPPQCGEPARWLAGSPPC